MAVLVEAISIITKRDAIQHRMIGGWDRFMEMVPNHTLCFDDHLARVGFMGPPDVEKFSNRLQRSGLRFFHNSGFVDFAVVDQREGPTARCDWLVFSHITFFDPPMTVATCELAGSREGESITVAFPPGWEYEKSLSKNFEFTPTEEFVQRYRFLRSENGVDVMLDLETGREIYVGRTR